MAVSLQPSAPERRSLLRSGGPALVDQASFAGSNFVLNVLLASWLAPEEYGTFAIAYALYLVGDAFHHALLGEPLLVFARRDYADRLEAYASAVWAGGAAISIGVAVFLLAGAALALAFGSPGLGRALAALGVAAPILLNTVLLRRICYARLSPEIAASGGALYAVFVASGLAVMHATGSYSAIGAVCILAVASLPSALCIALRLRFVPRPGPARGLARELVRRHWSYGRWAVLARLAQWAPWNLHYLILAGPLGLAGVGSLRALFNLVVPLYHLRAAMAMISLPLLSDLLGSGRDDLARRRAWRLGALFVGAGLACTVLGALYGEPLLQLLYDGAHSGAYDQAPYALAAEIPLAAMVVVGVVLRAAGHSGRALVAQLPFTLLSLCLASVGGIGWGIPGFVLGMLASATLGLGIVALLFRAWAPWRPPPEAGTDPACLEGLNETPVPASR